MFRDLCGSQLKISAENPMDFYFSLPHKVKQKYQVLLDHTRYISLVRHHTYNYNLVA